MIWMNIYLVCLIVGLSLSFLSLALGALHVDLPRHLGGFHFGAHAPHAAPIHGHLHVDPAGQQGAHVSAANFSTIMVFLAWFGGAGAILLGHFHTGSILALVGAVSSGVFGARLVLLFVRRVLLRHDHSMRAADYALPGTLATITLPIRHGGTGEIAYAQGGSRKSAAARSEDESSFANGAEVVVTRFVDGIAYVRRWD